MSLYSKSLIMAAAICLGCLGAFDVYEFKATVKTPQVFDNSASTGYRKYQNQHLKGKFKAIYDETGKFTEFQFMWLSNTTAKVSGKHFGYLCYVDDCNPVVFAAVGSNKTLKFKTGCIAFQLEAEPMYVSFAVPEDDNSLTITCAGKGAVSYSSKLGRSVFKTMSGNLAGTLGCGCADFGHVSPTRTMGIYGPLVSYPTDIAAVYGTWRAKLCTK